MKKYRYSILELTRRLLVIARPQRKLIFFATMASIIGNLAHMGLMGFGSALVLFCAGRYFRGSVLLWGGMTLLSAVLIGVMRFIEGVDSHASAYNLLADMRVSLFHKLHKLAPACLVDREKGDVLSVAVADIDTIENFFAHTTDVYRYTPTADGIAVCGRCPLAVCRGVVSGIRCHQHRTSFVGDESRS